MEFKHLIVITIVIIFTSFASSAMEMLGGAGGDEPTIIGGELSPCGKKIEEFKFFLRDGKRCIRDTDCIVIKGECPLGCKFYVNKNFETILSNRVDEVVELCEGSVCASVCSPPEEWAPAICTDKGKCVPDI